MLQQSEPLQQRLQTLIAIQLTNRVVQSDQVPSIDYVESQQKQQDQECRHLSKDRMQVISQGGSREREREKIVLFSTIKTLILPYIHHLHHLYKKFLFTQATQNMCKETHKS